MKVCVLGLGYIGLPTALVLADHGYDVLGFDINNSVIDSINSGIAHFYEPDINSLLPKMLETGRLRCSTQIEPVDTFVIAVPTPLTSDNKADLSAIQVAVEYIGPVLKSGNLVILESTSPVGTTEKLVEWFRELRPDLNYPSPGTRGEGAEINIAYCPERVLPGRVFDELIANGRIIGGLTRACGTRATEFYQRFVTGECISVDARMAELCKLTENSFRDINIAFANELSFVCDKLGIDVFNLIGLANIHPRVTILEPGPGVGGHCVAVDPWFIVEAVPEDTALISTARQVNEKKPAKVLQKISESITRSGISLNELSVACFGVTYKKNSGDLRGSPALIIVRELAQWSIGNLLVIDPHVNQEDIHKIVPTAQISEPLVALGTAEICVMLVDHDEFSSIDKSLLLGKQIVDTRGVWSELE